MTPAAPFPDALNRDLTLLDDLPPNNQATNDASPEMILEVGTVTFPDPLLATNRLILKFCQTGMTPIVCELRMLSRLVLEPTAAKQTMRARLSYGTSTFTGGVKVEVFMQDQVAFELTADEVTVEH